MSEIFNMYRAKPFGEAVSPKEFFKFAKDNDAHMLDMKFCDMLGNWQHCTYPISELDESIFHEGLGFDGSSVRGWQNISQSDMVAVCDASTACLDPFFAEPTVSLIADIKDPITKENYIKDPRYIARSVEEFLKNTGIADTVYIGPEPEFFIFDDVKYQQTQNCGYYEVDSAEGAWNTASNEEPNLGHKPRYKGGYFPVAPNDSLQDIRTDMVLEMQKVGIRVEAHHHEVASGGQCEIDMRFAPLLQMADQMMWYKYIVKNVAQRYGKTVTFMPKPIFGDNGSGMHTHLSFWKDGEPLFAGDQYAGLSEMALHAIGGILNHAPALLAFTNPTLNSYHRLVPGYEAPVNLAMSARNRSASIRIPMYSESPKAKRLEFRCPDPAANGYLAFAALTMAAIDGIQNKISPGKPLDRDIYAMTAAELQAIPSTPTSLEHALNALESGHQFLTGSGMFAAEFIDGWIDYKRESELKPLALRPHPFEFELYYDC